MATASTLEFEKPIAELERQIDELKRLAGERAARRGREEIAPLEQKLAELRGRGLPQSHAVASACRWRAAPRAPVHARLHPARVHRLHRAARRPALSATTRPSSAAGRGSTGETVMVIGQQRGRDTKENLKRNFGMPHPEGYRKALRLMKLAEKFHVPVITFIDTPGAWAGSGRRGARAVRGHRAQPLRDEPARGADRRRR